MTNCERQELQLISARLGQDLTEEQMELASDFTHPVVSFSNPGTGKSFSAAAGLIMAQRHHMVPGKKINVMSFTVAATAELKAKYQYACKKNDVPPTVQFNTLYSICYTIVKEVYKNMQIRAGIDYKRDLDVLARYMQGHDLDYSNMFYVRKVLETINALNSSLSFDEESVRRSYKFKQLDMGIEVFQALRKEWFTLGLCSSTIVQGDIPIYALWVLETNKEIQRKYRDKYQIMVVDEFQDFSLLHLKILSLITQNLIAIGDMKQQIYSFNGASQQIVEEYLKIYPTARMCNLTQSFRCTNEIAEFATRIVYPNGTINFILKDVKKPGY